MLRKGLFLASLILAVGTAALWVFSYYHDIICWTDLGDAARKPLARLKSDDPNSPGEMVFFRAPQKTLTLHRGAIRYRSHSTYTYLRFSPPAVIAKAKENRDTELLLLRFFSLSGGEIAVNLGRTEGRRMTGFDLRLWGPFVVFMVYPGVAFRAWLIRRRRPSRGLCLHCGYNLAGNTSGVCPECGAAVLGQRSVPRREAPVQSSRQTLSEP
ncbi:MAG: hypothetical protein HY718_02975 [Planctomycetes bacterium]|nr:hypothetical protein [Planctomycetota bacterium]